MPNPKDERTHLERRLKELKSYLAQVGELRPGSLVGRYRKCGKPTCHCAGEGSRGHGPSWSLTRRVAGKTVTRVIPTGPAVERTQEQLTEYRRFRNWIQEFIEVSDRWCHLQLEVPGGASEEGPQKRGSKRSSQRKSSRRSKPS